MTSLENADKEIQPEVLFYSNRSGLRASLCIHAIVTGACFISMYYFAIVDRPKMFEIEMRMAGSQMAPDEIAAHKYAVAIQGAVGVSLLSVVDFIYFAMGWRAVNTDRHVHRKLREFFWTAVLEALLAAFLCIFIRVSEGYQAVQALSKTLLALSAHHASDIVYRLHIRRRRAPSYFACFSPIGAPKRWTSSHARSPPPTEALPPVVEDDAEGLLLSHMQQPQQQQQREMRERWRKGGCWSPRPWLLSVQIQTTQQQPPPLPLCQARVQPLYRHTTSQHLHPADSITQQQQQEEVAVQIRCPLRVRLLRGCPLCPSGVTMEERVRLSRTR